jgi:hypothetical protein
MDVEVERTQEDSSKNGSPTLDREEILLSNPMKESQQHKFTMPKGDRNQNGKKNTETKITGKKARKLNKKREKIENFRMFQKGFRRRKVWKTGTSPRYQTAQHKKYSH